MQMVSQGIIGIVDMIGIEKMNPKEKAKEWLKNEYGYSDGSLEWFLKKEDYIIKMVDIALEEQAKEILREVRQFVRITFAGSSGILDIEEWTKNKEKEYGVNQND